jgi:hypothetical protein
MTSRSQASPMPHIIPPAIRSRIMAVFPHSAASLASSACLTIVSERPGFECADALS